MRNVIFVIKIYLLISSKFSKVSDTGNSGNTEKRINVEFYKNPSGNQPVREWLLEELSLEDRKIVGKDLLKIELDHPVDMPLCKYLGKGLWECRSNLTYGKIARVIFCIDGSRMIALVGFIKKSQRSASN